MRNVFRVFLRDLKRIAKAPASWSVVLFLLVLPSLYTWFNVLGFWDPYTNTGALPVCVVNEDAGTNDATLGELDLGKQIVEQLEENDQLDWQFMDRESAMQLLNEGKVYAVFVVPENFSTDLATIITDDFHQPQLEYYVNEKTGPVSPKITDIGSSTLDTTINDTFVSTVSSTIAQALNSAVSNSETKFDESKSKVVEQLNEVEQNLGDAGASVSDLSATASAAISKTEEAKASLDTAKAEIADMSLALTQLSSLTGTVNSSMLTSTSKLGTALDKGSVSVTGASAKANTAVSESANVIVQSQASVKEAATQAKSLTKTNEAYIDQLETLVDDLEKQIQSQDTSISDLQAEIDALSKKQADQEAIEQAVKDAIKGDGISGSGSGSSSDSSSSSSSGSSSGSSSSSSGGSSSGSSSAGSDSGSSSAGGIDISGIGALSDSTQQKIDELKKQLEEQKSDAEQQQAAKERAIKMLREVISSLRTVNSNVATQAGSLASFSDSVSASAKQVADTTDTITQAVNQTISAADDYRSVLSNDTIPQVSRALSSIGGTAASLGQIVGQQTALVDETGNVLDQLKTTLQTASGALDSTNGLITDAKSQIANVRTDIIALSTSNKLSELFGEDGSIDVDKVADFMKSPTEVVTEQLYPLNAYGSAMAPLFINLTLWIGVFMLMVIMHVEVDDEGIKKLKISERFLGRGLLFAIMVSLQAVICVAGCLYLGVQTVDAPRFFLTAICCSLTYLAIQYTLSATLQHVGKGLCVILVFVQIPAATGLYPVELTTGFFRAVYPLFPFTYGINAMRETICGFYGDTWIQLLGVLGVYFIVFLLIGVFIRPLFTNTNRMFARQLTETDIINHEAVQLPERRYRVEQIVRAMSDHDEFRSSLVQHSARFFKLYPKLKRCALIFGIAVPVLFTLGMAVLSPGKKVIILTAWLIWLVLIIGFLLIIEHIRDSLNRQAALDKMSDAELRELFSERNNVKGHHAAEAAADANSAGAADVLDGCATDSADVAVSAIVEGPVSDKEAEVLSAVSAFEPNVIHAVNVDSVELYCTKPVEVHCAFAKPVVLSVEDSGSAQGGNGDSDKGRDDAPDNQTADRSNSAQTTDSEGGDAR